MKFLQGLMKERKKERFYVRFTVQGRCRGRHFNEERCLIKTIRQRQKNWMGHVLRGDGLLRDVMEKRVLGRRRTGRPRQGMISDLKEAFCKEKIEENESEEDRKSVV